MKYRWAFCLAVVAGCAHVTAAQRAKLADPSMRFEMEPMADARRGAMYEMAEGATFRSAQHGASGAGCGCN